MTDYKHVILCYATLYACSAAMSIVCGCKTHDDRSGSLLCDKNIGEYYSIREWQDSRVVMNLNECIQDYDELSRGEVVPDIFMFNKASEAFENGCKDAFRGNSREAASKVLSLTNEAAYLDCAYNRGYDCGLIAKFTASQDNGFVHDVYDWFFEYRERERQYWSGECMGKMGCGYHFNLSQFSHGNTATNICGLTRLTNPYFRQWQAYRESFIKTTVALSNAETGNSARSDRGLVTVCISEIPEIRAYVYGHFAALLARDNGRHAQGNYSTEKLRIGIMRELEFGTTAIYSPFPVSLLRPIAPSRIVRRAEWTIEGEGECDCDKK